MSAVLDLLYSLGALTVAVGGLFGVWWLTRDERGAAGTGWRGLLMAVAAALFLVVMVGQFVAHLWATGF